MQCLCLGNFSLISLIQSFYSHMSRNGFFRERSSGNWKQIWKTWNANMVCLQVMQRILVIVIARHCLLLKLLYESIRKQAIWKGKWVELAINNGNGGQPNGNWWHDLLLKRVWDTHVPSWHCNWSCRLNLNLNNETLRTGAGSGLLISMLKILSLFHLTIRFEQLRCYWCWSKRV